MPKAIVITGPTGTGKSELAVDVAERLAGEVVSADSRQVYRGMDIGTAKPSLRLRSRVPHHGLDLVAVNESYSAGRFARDAQGWIRDIRARGRVPIVAGGSGFFVRALLQPLAPDPEVDLERRARLRDYLSLRSPEELKRWLRRLDPARAEQLEGEGGPQRLARSLEVALLSGRRHSWWMERPSKLPPLSALVFCLELPREEIYRLTDERFDRLMEGGFLEEVRGLLRRFPKRDPGFKAVGYGELISHLEGERSLTDAVAEAKRSTRQFVRRQLTWLRNQLPVDAIRLSANEPRERLVAEIARRWESGARRSSGSQPESPVASCG